MSGDVAELQYGQRVQLPGETSIVTVESTVPAGDKTAVIVADPDGGLRKTLFSDEQLRQVRPVTEDGAARPDVVLAGLWAERMLDSVRSATSTVLASSVLRPFPHQMSAVYGRMLPQPRLRFLLADEPGTGKTIMSGLWLREAQRLGMVKRALVVCPAHLVQKWQADFDRFFGGGLREITLETVREGVLSVSTHPTWVVSMHRAAGTSMVLEAIRPDQAGWDAVIVDEAHRMTPTAGTFHNVGTVLSKAEHALFLTATPHRGKEWLFQDLLHLVDPEVYPAGERTPLGRPRRRAGHRKLKPGSVHFLRRMKESLVDYDGRRKLFKPREAMNVKVPLSGLEQDFHDQALALVGQFFPPEARTLASIVYGKRTASSLYSLAGTLYRRLERMGTDPTAPVGEDWYNESEDDGGEDRIVGVRSMDVKAERSAILGMLGELEALIGGDLEASKWSPMINECLAPNEITPGSDRQVVVFTEYADTADWLVERFGVSGFAARRYSGRDDHLARAKVQADFRKGLFQVLVSTDAGNEGIDLQTANVLVNWDIPWSLVRLEQRLGRIHRIGQQRKVWFYNLVALGTLEGHAHEKLLDNLVKAANQLDGRIFDSLNAIMERLNIGGCFDFPTGPVSRPVTEDEIIRTFMELHTDTKYLESDIGFDLAITARRSELSQRIEPDTVERFLDRLVAAELITRSPMPLEQGFYYLTPLGWELPTGFRLEKGGESLITARERVRQKLIDGGSRRAEGATLLTPSRPVFHRFAEAVREQTAPAMWQGTVVRDRSAQSDYTLFAYESEIQTGEADGQPGKVSWLVSVDSGGTANRVAWETLPNLDSPKDAAPKPLDRQAESAAVDHADHLATAETLRRKAEANKWANDLKKDLRDLPSVTTAHISDRNTRIRRRQETEANIQKRIHQARQRAQVSHTQPRRVGWAHVIAGKEIRNDPDSEEVGMRHVTHLLEQEDFIVKDVHTENRGFDLLAERGAEQRCVEVKGRSGSASSTGIEMTGGERDAARLHGDDYWLYVVEHCENGVGNLYAAWQNPLEVFGGDLKQVTVIWLSGSALKAARGKAAH